MGKQKTRKGNIMQKNIRKLEKCFKARKRFEKRKDKIISKSLKTFASNAAGIKSKMKTLNTVFFKCFKKI